MATVEIPRSGEIGVEINRFEVSASNFDINDWYIIRRDYSEVDTRFLFVYKQPVITYGGGVYTFEGKNGFYTVDGSVRAVNESGFRYKWITYFGLNYYNLGRLDRAFTDDVIRNLLGVSSDVKISTNFGLGDFRALGKEKGSINSRMLYGFVNSIAIFDWDAFEMMTPDDSISNRYPYVVSLFEKLYPMSAAPVRVNSSIFAAQVAQYENRNINLGLCCCKVAKPSNLVVVAKCNFIVNESVPNICQRPFEGIYCFSQWDDTVIPGASGIGSVTNFCYLGVEAT